MAVFLELERKRPDETATSQRLAAGPSPARQGPASAKRTISHRGFGHLWHQERRSRITELLRADDRAGSAAIARALGVSRETVRRDLLAMEAEGLLQRVHGGAVSLGTREEAPFERRKRHHWQEKLEIGRLAAALVEQGMIVFVDAGTTTLAFAEALVGVAQVEVITNSLGVAQRLGTKAILLGGRMTSDVPATFGELTLSEIERFRADIAFVAPVGVHPVGGITNYALHEAEVARLMMRRSDRSIVLADSSKLGVQSRVSVAELSEAECVITDAQGRARYREMLGEKLYAGRP